MFYFCSSSFNFIKHTLLFNPSQKKSAIFLGIVTVNKYTCHPKFCALKYQFVGLTKMYELHEHSEHIFLLRSFILPFVMVLVRYKFVNSEIAL